MIRIGAGAWIRDTKESGNSYFFPLHPENHGKTEVSDGMGALLINCANESVGGGVDENEMPIDGLLRELREERRCTNITQDQISALPDAQYVEQRRKGKWVDFIVSLFLLKLTDEQIVTLTNEQHLFAIPDEQLKQKLLEKNGDIRFFRPFTSAFGLQMIRTHFYRQ